MSKSDDARAEAMNTPLGKAFQRLLEDEKFAGKVIDSADAVAAEYGLDADDKAALLGDAHALEGEVSGFSRRGFGVGIPMDFGGLLSPARLGVPSASVWQCPALTMT